MDLLFDWFRISCMTTNNFCFYLQNRLIQTSQTGGQWYNDTSPFSIPWIEGNLFYHCTTADGNKFNIDSSADNCWSFKHMLSSSKKSKKIKVQNILLLPENIALFNSIPCTHIEKADMHWQGIAFTWSFYAGLTSPEDKKLYHFKWAANNI